MQFFIFVLLICLFVFLYCVYLLAHDDFIFLRRDLTMERLFNIIFLGSLSCLFFARLFYGLFTPHHFGEGFTAKHIFSNPFIFLLFPYFPGLSLLGGVLGAGVFFLFLRARSKNPLPLGRLADFFSIAFLATLPVGFLGYFMFAEEGFSAIRAGSLAVTYFMLFVVFLRFLLPQLLNGRFKEGTIAFVFLVCFCVVSLILNALSKMSFLDFFKSFENIVLILIFVSSIVLIFRQENLLLKIKEFRRKK